MNFVTIYNGIVFIEGEHPRAIRKYNAYTRIGGFGAQLRNLNDLKHLMSNKARENGCNCIVDFSYGQEHRIVSIDDVLFVGNGFYAVLSDSDYNNIISKF